MFQNGKTVREWDSETFRRKGRTRRGLTMTASMTLPATIAELAPQLRKKEVSPVEATQDCLKRIEEHNPALNAFITVTPDAALGDAKQAEAEILRGEWRGPLHGVPVSLKDLIDTAGVRTTSASELQKDYIPAEDADVVLRLREAGAVIVGKNNLHEFAYGGSSLVGYFGDVRNPWNVEHVAGGSSGGSAAAVAGGMVYAAIGTDTAGSIREPASLCGCVGLKPTFGRVSNRGVFPLSASLDHTGPLTTTVADAAIVLQAIAGYDVRDAGSANVPVTDYSCGIRESLKALRVGVPRDYFFDGLDPEVASAMEHALAGLRMLGANIKEVTLHAPTDRTLQAAESYAVHAENIAKSSGKYQPETLRRIKTGENISAADYIQCRRELEMARRTIATNFAEVDVLVTPTTPISSPVIADLKSDPAALRPAEIKLLRNTRPFNVWGLPAISLPCGFTSTGLPIGLQIAGPHWREDVVLRAAYAYEQATAWHKRRP